MVYDESLRDLIIHDIISFPKYKNIHFDSPLTGATSISDVVDFVHHTQHILLSAKEYYLFFTEMAYSLDQNMSKLVPSNSILKDFFFANRLTEDFDYVTRTAAIYFNDRNVWKIAFDDDPAQDLIISGAVNAVNSTNLYLAKEAVSRAKKNNRIIKVPDEKIRKCDRENAFDVNLFTKNPYLKKSLSRSAVEIFKDNLLGIYKKPFSIETLCVNDFKDTPDDIYTVVLVRINPDSLNLTYSKTARKLTTRTIKNPIPYEQ